MKKLILIMTLVLFSSTAWSFDKGLADSYAQYYQPFDGKVTSKACHFIKAPDFIKALKSDKKPFVIDVRTLGETSIITLGVSDKLVAPMNHVFAEENLSRIPTDRKVVVVCKEGVRAMSIATALRHTGFDNVYVLKGGLDELAKYLNPKCAN